MIKTSITVVLQLLFIASTTYALRGGIVARRTEDCMDCDGVNDDKDDDDYYDDTSEMANNSNLDFELTAQEEAELDGLNDDKDEDDYYDEQS
eukprot:CAMPEP_0116024840 /NCGR_PEP_ID=MMETSP0321-20121206/12613_1 /TAXON_ID=163516 /ORGANISM="Leptocylindrus danicus var. danicus, Strain B650" /LENGTH=91 /DNA_ID=CAMNT_0003496761 /DNA_START=11 /DNA_END=286 /DNA_ORIENTATION=+